jgi:D-glycero-D-manno-heptose 1,7-bisphosphate phosphatase
MNRAAFLDRDGVINRKAREGEYVTRWEEMQILPEVPEAIARLNQAGLRVIVVSNQRCVAKGLITIAGLEALHQQMCETLASAEATIDAVYYCPHEKEPPCQCRKPAPGMLLDAAREHEIDLRASWMIGDSQADLEAGSSVGCRMALIAGTNDGTKGEPEVVATSLLDAVQQILERESFRSGRRLQTSTSRLSPGNDE